MAATMKIFELSASLVGTDKTGNTVRFKLADNATVDSNNAVIIPAGNYIRRSYTKQLRMYCATAPDTQINNLQVYTDGGEFGTGINVYASPIAPADFAANATTWGNTTDLFTYVTGTRLDMDANDSVAITATGFGGDILKVQLCVASSASSGTLTAETITFSYDEV